MKAKDIGNLGEEMAVKFLLEKGYEIVERNFLKPFGEIDIIAKDKDFLVFIEVKARKNINFGFPREFVNGSKIKKIQDVAQIYMMEKKLFGAKIRFETPAPAPPRTRAGSLRLARCSRLAASPTRREIG